ncbi:spermatogenesis associated 11, putative [Brugia malayi]|uniref:Spermatogenesis associated 11, putative n=1 Tax=Brugia malayi TaxID=6279 RepID=A0A4E9FBK3_BRUMA|nr:spermatogenesis associated 11, putative [Brugia malayi]VIO93589.1 spermatogenesis associated 11, putative [Brugia malayi]
MHLSVFRHSAVNLIHFHNHTLWSKEMKNVLLQCCTVIPNFITKDEEISLLDEINPHMKRIRYEKSHWDDAIHLYREREQLKWRKENEAILDRIRKHSFEKEDKQHLFVHILDLHEDGVIKPHIDSVRYCGDVITGLSLLSDAVMRLRHKDRKDELIVDLFLQQRCLYRMAEFSRYEFYHEVLGKAESYFMEKPIPRSRRISIVCRDLPRNVQENESHTASNIVGKRELLQRSDTERI